MRLIDADSLKERMFAEIPEHEKGVVDIFLEAVAAMIDEQPTIERKKGKWNVYYHGETDFSYSCNQCGYSAPYGQYGGEYSQKEWRFCPNCGSYMRGDKHETD